MVQSDCQMIFNIIKYLLVAAIVLGVSDYSYAQNQPNQNVGGANGALTEGAATGTVIAAAMETVGYQAQAQILVQMKNTFRELGGLIFIGVMLSALITAGLLGNYAPILWLALGPPIFIFTSGVDIGGKFNQLNTKGPDWKFGSFKDTANFKTEVMRRNDTPVDVSFFFHKYNELISEIYQNIINKITSEDVSSQMLFMARQRIMEDLFAMRMTDPMSHRLSGFFNTHCSKEMSLARQIAAVVGSDGAEVRTNYEALREQYCKLLPLENKRIDSPSLEEYLTTLNPKHVVGDVVSCARLWDWLSQSLVKDVASQAEASLDAAIPQEARITALGYEGVSRRIVDDFLKKVTKKVPNRETVDDPCAHGTGDIQSQGITSQGDSFTMVANIMSQVMFKKELVRSKGKTYFQKILAGDESGLVELEDSIGNGSRQNMRSINEQTKRIKGMELANAKKYETFVFLSALPYFQGALLYILSVLYPFFALMLIVPGRAGAFLNWMALWAWVKSWDIGWAIVMVTDKLLWTIMPNNSYFDISSDASFTPINTMEMQFSGDNTFSVSAYWAIVGILITSVPIISAEIILGAKRGVASALLGGASDLATRLSTAAENYTSTRNIGVIADQYSHQQIQNMSGAVHSANQVGAQINQAADANMSNNTELGKLYDGATGSMTGANPEPNREESAKSRVNSGTNDTSSKDD